MSDTGVFAGAMCGGTTIDRELHTLMNLRYGKAFTGKPPQDISHGSNFMTNFESIKRGFDGNGKERKLHLMMDHDDTQTYVKGLQEITLTR